MKKLVVLKPLPFANVGDVLTQDNSHRDLSHQHGLYLPGWSFGKMAVDVMIERGWLKWQEEEDELVEVLEEAGNKHAFVNQKYRAEATAVRKFFREKFLDIAMCSSNRLIHVNEVLKLFEERE